MTHDPKNVRRWLATLADHYPSLLVSGVARNALAEIERLAGVGYAMSHEHLAIATEAIEAHQKAMAYHGGDIDFALWDALTKIKEMK